MITLIKMYLIMFISYSRADPEGVGDSATSVHREAIFSWTTEETEDKLLLDRVAMKKIMLMIML